MDGDLYSLSHGRSVSTYVENPVQKTLSLRLCLLMITFENLLENLCCGYSLSLCPDPFPTSTCRYVMLSPKVVVIPPKGLGPSEGEGGLCSPGMET